MICDGIRELSSPEWHPIETAPAGVVVETKIDDQDGVRNVQNLYRDGRIWWMLDGYMYVYYTPTHWRFLEKLSDAHSKNPPEAEHG